MVLFSCTLAQTVLTAPVTYSQSHHLHVLDHKNDCLGLNNNRLILLHLKHR